MVSEVKQIICTEILDLGAYQPADEESFSFSLTLSVGQKGEPGAEYFDITVCTPKWLMKQYKEDDMLLGRYKLIVFKFDMDKILARIRKAFDNVGGDNWSEIAVKLSRIGHWEFENYQPYRPLEA